MPYVWCSDTDLQNYVTAYLFKLPHVPFFDTTMLDSMLLLYDSLFAWVLCNNKATHSFTRQKTLLKNLTELNTASVSHDTVQDSNRSATITVYFSFHRSERYSLKQLLFSHTIECETINNIMWKHKIFASQPVHTLLVAHYLQSSVSNRFCKG